MQICQATTREQIVAIRALFQEYAACLRIDLCFQGFTDELASLPGHYAPPRGRLLLASSGNEPAGCVALRPSNAVCEMKRLFVRPAHQGQGLGRRLAEYVITEARAIGYSTMILDTLPSMHRAIRLYEALGFRRRSAYYDTPLHETVFMELQL
jgi:GNAT superfamily N-acetyltransferase